MHASNQQQSELVNLIEFAFSERKFKKVIDLIEQHNKAYPECKEIHILQARSYSELSKAEQCICALNKAIALGASIKQVSVLAIRSYLEIGNPKEAEKAMEKLLASQQQLKKIVELKQAIQIMKDKFDSHRLPEPQQKIVQAMKAWLFKAGATFPKLKLLYLEPGYRGTIATKHINKKQPIVYVPKSQLITLQMAKANKYSRALIEKKVRLQSPKHTYLAILLLQLKGAEDSKFRPYIELLPQDHSCFPINYSKQQLEMLQGSPFLNMVFEKVIDLKKDYEAILKTDGAFSKYSFKQFCWARMMIGSRIFGLLISGVKTEVLVPFADMLNHRHPKQTVWNYEQSINGFVIQSLEDIEVGQEVFDSYGRKCNSRFLLNYGFIIQENNDNQIALKITIDMKDPLFASKLHMIKENITENYTQIKKINLNCNNNKFYELMGCLRFICVDQSETIDTLKKISNVALSNQPYLMIRTPPISVKNEVLVWQKLLSICKAQLQAYPNTLQYDQKILKQQNLSQNQKNIIILRMGEKYILNQFIQICTQVLTILKSQNILNSLKENITKAYARYLYKILCLTPGVNKKELQKSLGAHFSHQPQDNITQQLEQVAQH